MFIGLIWCGVKELNLSAPSENFYAHGFTDRYPEHPANLFLGYFINTSTRTTLPCLYQFHPWLIHLSTGYEYSANKTKSGVEKEM